MQMCDLLFCWITKPWRFRLCYSRSCHAAGLPTFPGLLHLRKWLWLFVALYENPQRLTSFRHAILAINGRGRWEVEASHIFNLWHWHWVIIFQAIWICRKKSGQNRKGLINLNFRAFSRRWKVEDLPSNNWHRNRPHPEVHADKRCLIQIFTWQKKI